MMERVFKEEKGIAIIAAVGAVVVLLVLSFGLIVYTENALQKVIEHRRYVKALNLADAGIDHVTWLYKTDSLPDSYYDNKVTLDFGSEGKCVFQVEQGDVGFEKRVISVGYAPDGTKKAVRVTLFSMNIWDLMLSAGNENPDRRPGGSGGIAGNGMVQGPLYIRGGLPMLFGTFDIYEGPLFVKDGSVIKGSSAGNLGTSIEPLTAYIEGDENGAIFKKQGNNLVPLDPWTPSMNIYISNLSRKVPDIEFPALTQELIQDLYNLSSQEGSDDEMPSYPKGASTIGFNESLFIPTVRTAFGIPAITNYKVIDNNGAPDQSLVVAGQNVNIGPASFGMLDIDGDSDIDNTDSTYYEFSYNAATRELFIRGTVFIDGNLVISLPVSYQGRGTLVVNGNCVISDALLASSDFPQTNAIGLVIKGDLYINTPSSNDAIDDVQAAIYTEGDVVFGSTNTRFYGAMIAGYIDMTSANNIQLVLADALPSNLPPSLPAAESNIVTIIGWKEIPVPAGF